MMMKRIGAARRLALIKRLNGVPLRGGGDLGEQLRRPHVLGIAHDGKTERGEMNANLMRAAGEQAAEQHRRVRLLAVARGLKDGGRRLGSFKKKRLLSLRWGERGMRRRRRRPLSCQTGAPGQVCPALDSALDAPGEMCHTLPLRR